MTTMRENPDCPVCGDEMKRAVIHHDHMTDLIEPVRLLPGSDELVAALEADLRFPDTRICERCNSYEGGTMKGGLPFDGHRQTFSFTPEEIRAHREGRFSDTDLGEIFRAERTLINRTGAQALAAVGGFVRTGRVPSAAIDPRPDQTDRIDRWLKERRADIDAGQKRSQKRREPGPVERQIVRALSEFAGITGRCGLCHRTHPEIARLTLKNGTRRRKINADFWFTDGDETRIMCCQACGGVVTRAVKNAGSRTSMKPGEVVGAWIPPLIALTYQDKPLIRYEAGRPVADGNLDALLARVNGGGSPDTAEDETPPGRYFNEESFDKALRSGVRRRDEALFRRMMEGAGPTVDQYELTIRRI